MKQSNLNLKKKKKFKILNIFTEQLYPYCILSIIFSISELGKNYHIFISHFFISQHNIFSSDLSLVTLNHTCLKLSVLLMSASRTTKCMCCTSRPLSCPGKPDKSIARSIDLSRHQARMRCKGGSELSISLAPTLPLAPFFFFCTFLAGRL